MPSLSLAPALPIPAQQVKVTFSGLNPATNHVRLVPTIAPEGSTTAGLIEAALKASTTPAPVHEGDANSEWIVTFDKGGPYTFTLYEETVQTASKRFDGDTYGAPRTTIVATSTVVLQVGTKLTLQVGQQPHAAQLTVYGWGDYVRPTTIGEHGVATPVLENPTSPEAKSAVKTAAVVAAVAALANATYATILGDLQAAWDNLVYAYNNHISLTAFHTNADPYSGMGTAFSVATSQKREKAINEFIRVLQNHMNSVKVPDPAATDPSDPPLQIHGTKDGLSTAMILGAGRGTAEQYSALADAALTYAAHSDADSPVHTNPNSAPSIASTPLFSVFLEFQRVIRSASPVVPPDISGVVSRLTTFGGFKA